MCRRSRLHVRVISPPNRSKNWSRAAFFLPLPFLLIIIFFNRLAPLTLGSVTVITTLAGLMRAGSPHEKNIYAGIHVKIYLGSIQKYISIYMLHRSHIYLTSI